MFPVLNEQASSPKHELAPTVPFECRQLSMPIQELLPTVPVRFAQEYSPMHDPFPITPVRPSHAFSGVQATRVKWSIRWKVRKQSSYDVIQRNNITNIQWVIVWVQVMWASMN